ncbi:MAG: AMP-binding protein [Gammaproteobacteria bacterium]|nr:AMP-binding protein [Gammaproteobacteria bacterium]
MHLPGGIPTGHVDQYIRTLLPPPDRWPVFDYSNSPLPDDLNAGATLIDGAIAAGYGDRPAYHFAGETWSYRRLLAWSERIARVLTEDFGLVPGNRVLLRATNSPMLVACWLAVLKAGGIGVTTMPLLRAHELRQMIDRVRIRFALCDVSLLQELETARSTTATLERIGCFTPLGTGDAADLDVAAAAKPVGFANARTAADDVAVITFTSGTTGTPKAAAHFHRDLLAICACLPRRFPFSPDEVIGGSPSIAFSYGLSSFVIYPLRFRAAVALVAKPTPDRLLDAIARHRVTTLIGVPTSYRQLLHELRDHDLRSVRRCASAGETLPRPLWQAWLDSTGLRLVNGIGATETISHFLSETPTVDRPGSTGRPVPGYTVRLLDPDGRELPPGSTGRLALRGPTGCRYLDDPERQAQFVQHGWNVTGDVFSQDEEGYFWFVDREDDLIVSSGYNISPLEIEQQLLEHPLVSDCGVVGTEDAERGQRVRACVVLTDAQQRSDATARMLQEFVKDRLAPYKYPREIRFYEQLPRTHTGKLQRKQLRAE